MSNPYKAADSFEWGNPPDYPDPPEFDMVPQGCWVSECCLLSISKAKNGSFICECGKFCRIDEDASINEYMTAIKRGDFDD